MAEWRNFDQEVRSFLSTIDLNVGVEPDMKTEHIYVGSEIGVTGRISQNIGNVVGSIFRSTKNVAGVNSVFSSLRFGDYHMLTTGTRQVTARVPDVVICSIEASDDGSSSSEEETLRAVGEYKTSWTCQLQKMRVDSENSEHLRALGGRLGILTWLLVFYICLRFH